MSARILVLGGYGTFGSFICRRLSETVGLTIIVAGRSLEKARALAAQLPVAEAERIDVTEPLDAALARVRPDIVIHTSGPFQGQSYAVAEACIRAGSHYIDLADGRDFVSGIGVLDAAARERGVTLVSGASSVPALTSAIADHYRPRFAEMRELDYAITTAQRTGRGLATTRAILGYVGQSFLTIEDGRPKTVHGWQGLTWRRYRQAGRRFLGYCDIPDHAIFPGRYPGLRTIRFRAGLEVPLAHLGLWALSWFVRIGAVRTLAPLAPALLGLSNRFDRFGTDVSAFHMRLSGASRDGTDISVTFELTARSGDGPNIPCVPAILLACKLADGTLRRPGAIPCVGLISLHDYLAELASLDISWDETEAA
ncbi:saccharopine dehydrogenase family protein [Nisaea sediminum]|uniref:saccharopine dehydrogenase family protein n=1 Tax=Nisaea sediminum TaxID=2775867 RepID=UPI00186845B6|nr:saccharopine dehydrogenase NADP-binding domain-containing protein [Nisaea sediminum]